MGILKEGQLPAFSQPLSVANTNNPVSANLHESLGAAVNKAGHFSKIGIPAYFRKVLKDTGILPGQPVTPQQYEQVRQHLGDDRISILTEVTHNYAATPDPPPQDSQPITTLIHKMTGKNPPPQQPNLTIV